MDHDAFNLSIFPNPYLSSSERGISREKYHRKKIFAETSTSKIWKISSQKYLWCDVSVKIQKTRLRGWIVRGRQGKLTFRERRDRRSRWRRPIRRKCPSLVRGGGGGWWISFPSAQPSGFFFVGIGPVGGTSFPFELTATVGGTILQRQSLPLFPPPLLQHHPLSPSRQWTVGPPRREKLNRERETRTERGREGGREGEGMERSRGIYLKIPFIREG